MNSVVIGGIVRINRKKRTVTRMRLFPEDVWQLVKEFLLYSNEEFQGIQYARQFNLHRRVELMLRRAYTPHDIADDTFLDVSGYRPLCRGFYMSSAVLMQPVNCWTYEDWNRTKRLEYKVEVEPYLPDSRYTMVELARETNDEHKIVTYQMGPGERLADGESYVYKTYVEVISLINDKMKIVNRLVTVTVGVGIGGKRLITPEMIAHIRDCKSRGVFDAFAITDYDRLAFVIPERTEYQDVSIAEFYKL